jgi:hypothetical protein
VLAEVDPVEVALNLLSGIPQPRLMLRGRGPVEVALSLFGSAGISACEKGPSARLLSMLRETPL